MNNLQKFLAWVCAILFVITAVMAMLLFNIERKAFSAETFKQAFEKQELYTHMPAIMADALHTSISQDENADPYLKVLTVADWEASIANLLPPEELKILSEDTLNSIFGYLNNETDSVTVSLLLLKRQLSGPQGAEVVQLILSAQPDCTLEQLMQMGLGFLSGELTICKPPEEMMGLVTPLIESQLQFIVGTIPDQVNLISGEKSKTPDDPRIRLNFIRTITKWTPLFPVMFLIGVTTFAVRNLADWLKWWGIPFIITGILGTFAALISMPLVPWMMEAVILQIGPDMPPVFLGALGNITGSFTREIIRPVFIQAIILVILGAGLIVGKWIINRNGHSSKAY